MNVVIMFVYCVIYELKKQTIVCMLEWAQGDLFHSFR